VGDMVEKYYLDVVFKKEKLSDGRDVFVAHCTSLGIASQGFTLDEATENIQEAAELYLEEQPEKYQDLDMSFSFPSFSILEVKRDAKTSSIIR
jgi:predicted RNase H-like HicB family nuclease